MPDLDSWLDDAAHRCARACGLDPKRVHGRTDYSSMWAIEYDGELTLGQIVRVARFMWGEEGPANHLMASIYDRSGRIVSSSLVEALAGRGAYPLGDEPREPGERTWHDFVDNLE